MPIDHGPGDMPRRQASDFSVGAPGFRDLVTPEGVIMCGEHHGAGSKRSFDPTRCPLLQGLSSEEADRMMRTDPRIRACIGAVESGAPVLEPCVAKMVKAHDARGAMTSRVA